MNPWLNTTDAAQHLRYTGKQPLRSVYRFMARHHIVPRQDGKRLLIARADLDRALVNLQRRRSHAAESAAPQQQTHDNKVAVHQ